MKLVKHITPPGNYCAKLKQKSVVMHQIFNACNLYYHGIVCYQNIIFTKEDSMKNTTKIMFCMVLFSSNTQALHKNLYEIPMPTIQSIEEVVPLFPKTVKQIKELTETTIKKAEQQIATLLQIPLDQLTFDNTVRVFHRTVDTFSRTIAVLEITFMLYPQANLREAAQKEVVKLRQLFVDLFSQNKDLYLVLARHEQTRAPLEDLTEQERYFMQETLKEYRRHGLDLPEDERTAIKPYTKTCQSYHVV